MPNYDASSTNTSKRANVKYKDLDLDFGRNTVTNDINKLTDVESVKRSVRNLINTSHFERPFHPEIGTQIQSLMFENFTSAVKIAMERTIRESIEKFEPRVRLIELVVDEAEDSNELVVNIIFALKNTNNPITITTFISRVR
jgi:phage baseplate assembly protein W